MEGIGPTMSQAVPKEGFIAEWSLDKQIKQRARIFYMEGGKLASTTAIEGIFVK